MSKDGKNDPSTGKVGDREQNEMAVPLLSAHEGAIQIGRPVQDSPGNESSSAAAQETLAADSLAAAAPPSATVVGTVANAESVKRVCCAACFVQTDVQMCVSQLACSGCGITLRAGDQPALQVVCFSCRAPNLVNAGVTKFRCGQCKILVQYSLPHMVASASPQVPKEV
mmetsp:Transcript_16933/g.45912  ORF Transcript_16933/g.45912 Transcript_16933/m.45912 type:complete len:169 (-) Transcript_16933:76-582(-)